MENVQTLDRDVLRPAKAPLEGLRALVSEDRPKPMVELCRRLSWATPPDTSLSISSFIDRFNAE